MFSINSKIDGRDERDALAAHRERMMLPLAMLGACSFFPFFVYNLFQGNYLLGGAILALTLIFFFNGYAIYRQKKVVVPFQILLLPAAAAIVLSIVNQGTFGSYWCYPLLLFFYFVLSRRMATVCGVLLLVLVTIILFKYTGFALTTRFTISLSLLIIMVNIIIKTIDGLHRQLLEQTIRDPLTGAFNRRYMESRLTETVAQKTRKVSGSSLLALDIDYFKRVNDDLGHAAGDEVLKGLVKIINNRIRKSDKLFRVGGEEFLLFLAETDEANAVTVAEELRSLISDAALLEDRAVTVSVGVSELRPGEALESWIKRADEALYRAKASGRNQVCLSGSESAGTEKETVETAG